MTKIQQKQSDTLITRQKARALDHNAAIERGDASAKLGTCPNLLARFSLIPSRGIGSVTSWARQNDYATVGVSGGWSHTSTGKARQLPVPRGGIANLCVFWLVNEVQKNLRYEVDRPERVELGDTLNGFLSRIGSSRGGEQRRVARQSVREVLGAQIQLVKHLTATSADACVDGDYVVNGTLSEEFLLWNSEPGGALPIGSFATASPFLMQLASAPSAVPVRLDLLAQLADSVLAQQALMWLSLKVWTLDVQGKPSADYEWADLYRNITHSYASEKKFREAFKQQLARAAMFFPDLTEYLDLSAVPDTPTGSRGGQQRVIRIKRGARPLVAVKS